VNLEIFSCGSKMILRDEITCDLSAFCDLIVEGLSAFLDIAPKIIHNVGKCFIQKFHKIVSI